MHCSRECLTDGIVPSDVRNLQLEQIVNFPRQTVELQNLGNFFHCRGKSLEPFVCIFRRAQHDEHSGANAEHLGIEKCHALANDAIFLQLPNAPPAGVMGQMYLFCDLGDGARCVLLQEIENFDVHGVESWHRPSPLFTENRRTISQNGIFLLQDSRCWDNIPRSAKSAPIIGKHSPGPCGKFPVHEFREVTAMLKFLQDHFASAYAPGGRRSHARSMRAMAGTILVACAWGCIVHSPVAEASTEQVVWSFGNGTDGKDPYAGLLYDKTLGTLYGTTSGGGTYRNGTLFSLIPGTNTENLLWSFGNGSDANQPYGNVIRVNGELYGATTGGGNDDVGTVFSFDPQTNTETVLHSFNVNNGQAPYYLVKVKDKLYGTTPWGGPGTGYNGTVYSYNLKTGSTKVLYYFSDAPDSSHPYGALVNVNGTLYGTAYAGGMYGYGTVFSFNPETHAETVLWSLGNGTDGRNPGDGLIDEI